MSILSAFFHRPRRTRGQSWFFRLISETRIKRSGIHEELARITVKSVATQRRLTALCPSCRFSLSSLAFYYTYGLRLHGRQDIPITRMSASDSGLHFCQLAGVLIFRVDKDKHACNASAILQSQEERGVFRAMPPEVSFIRSR